MRIFLTYIFYCFTRGNNGSVNRDISLSVYLNGSYGFYSCILCCLLLFCKII